MEKADFLKGGIEFYKIRILKTILFHLVILMMNNNNNNKPQKLPEMFTRSLGYVSWSQLWIQCSLHFTGKCPFCMAPHVEVPVSILHARSLGACIPLKQNLTRNAEHKSTKGFLLANRWRNHGVFSTYNLRDLWFMQAEVRGHPQNEKKCKKMRKGNGQNLRFICDRVSWNVFGEDPQSSLQRGQTAQRLAAPVAHLCGVGEAELGKQQSQRWLHHSTCNILKKIPRFSWCRDEFSEATWVYKLNNSRGRYTFVFGSHVSFWGL